ncbi:CRISPR-associated DxTHG motif protein [Sphingobacterium sp. arapr2]|nr:CRISPR-associated DxTHG motif protein [Sphingobacterium prati]
MTDVTHGFNMKFNTINFLELWNI